eukprot:COSAG04_NODE_1301_length_7315_cov_12.447755_2_plen_158_part_00
MPIFTATAPQPWSFGLAPAGTAAAANPVAGLAASVACSPKAVTSCSSSASSSPVHGPSRLVLPPGSSRTPERWIVDSCAESAATPAPTAALFAGGLATQRPPAAWYLSIKNRSATHTLFLRPYLAHFCPVFSRFFAVFSVLKPGFQKVAPKDRGPVP